MLSAYAAPSQFLLHWLPLHGHTSVCPKDAIHFHRYQWHLPVPAHLQKNDNNLTSLPPTHANIPLRRWHNALPYAPTVRRCAMDFCCNGRYQRPSSVLPLPEDNPDTFLPPCAHTVMRRNVESRIHYLTTQLCRYPCPAWCNRNPTYHPSLTFHNSVHGHPLFPLMQFPHHY